MTTLTLVQHASRTKDGETMMARTANCCQYPMTPRTSMLETVSRISSSGSRCLYVIWYNRSGDIIQTDALSGRFELRDRCGGCDESVCCGRVLWCCHCCYNGGRMLRTFLLNEQKPTLLEESNVKIRCQVACVSFVTRFVDEWDGVYKEVTGQRQETSEEYGSNLHLRGGETRDEHEIRRRCNRYRDQWDWPGWFVEIVTPGQQALLVWWQVLLLLQLVIWMKALF